MMDIEQNITNKVILPKNAVLEFMEIYKKRCKQKISFKEAQTEALNLLCLFNLLS